MSELPAINHEKVSGRLASKLAESILQSAQLEVLAEALRDERDIATQNQQSLQRTIEELQSKAPDPESE